LYLYVISLIDWNKKYIDEKVENTGKHEFSSFPLFLPAGSYARIIFFAGE